MDRQYIDENDIVIKYLKNQLSDEELEVFEVYLMNNPDLIDQVFIDEQFLKSAMYSAGTNKRQISYLRYIKESLAWFVGGSVVTATMMIVFTNTGSLTSIADVDVHYLAENQDLRGGLDGSSATKKINPKGAVFVLETGRISQKVERVSFYKGESDTPFLTIQNIKTDDLGDITLFVGRDKMASGPYRAETLFEGSKKEFSFRVE